MTKYLGIEIDYTRDSLLPEQGLVMLTKEGFYKLPHEKSPQECFARAATSYCFGDYVFAQRIYDYASKGWFTFASPVLSNALEIPWRNKDFFTFQSQSEWLRKNVQPKGMPISCFLSYIPDTKEGLVKSSNETRVISMNGGGIGIMPAMRSPDNKSTGVMAHLRGYDADALSYKQTEARRGSIAAYMDIDHPEIMSFMEMRNPVGGDANKKCFNLNNGVNIPDSFMLKVIKGESYELIDPKHGATGRFLEAREVWEKLMNLRDETGEPFIKFSDTVNRSIPKHITNPLYNVKQSNLCSEITLMTDEERTAVCCLSSLNLEHYDEWKDTSIVKDLVLLLDNVLEFFIQLAPPELERAIFSAYKERAIGIGTLGLHSYLQKNMIPFESGGFDSATQHINKIYSKLKKDAYAESKLLAEERGEPDDLKGSGMRNSHMFAIAPNASSASMVGSSPSTEPWAANAFTASGRAGVFLIKNKYLAKVLERYGKNTKEVWDSIIESDGSVLHLDFLSDLEKKVFKTSFEIDQQWVILHAAERQKYICQAQSTNIFMKKGSTLQRMSDLHILAWTKGVKTLYYCRAESAVDAKVTAKEAPTQPLNKVEVDISFNECIACEG